MQQSEAERNAFARAFRYLNFNPTAKWSALGAAVGTGLLYLALLIVLWLFADLMVHRGAIPAYRDLSRADQEKFQEHWKGLPEDKHSELLTDIGLDPGTVKKLASADPAELSSAQHALIWRAYLFALLRDQVGGVAAVLVLPSYPDLPPDEQEAFLRAWEQLPARQALLESLRFTENENPDLDVNNLGRTDPRKLSDAGKEVIWRAHLYNLLANREKATRRDADAANYLAQRLEDEAASRHALVAAEYSNLEDRGILSLVVRTHVRNNLSVPGESPLSRYNPYRASSSIQGAVAYWNPWMWRYGSTSQPTFFYYLTGLLVVALLFTIGRAGLGYLLHHMSARATIEAATRLRRAVYHHTYRLGTLTVRALGPGEAVTVFTRHVEAVLDGLYTWLTVLFPQPVKFGLLLAFALVIYPLLALTFLLFAVLVWLMGGQAVTYFRRQERSATHQAAEQLTLIRESLMLMRLVKCYLMEPFNQARVERQLSRHAGAQLRRYAGEAMAEPLLIALGLGAAVVLLYIAGLIVLHGQLDVAAAITMAAALVSLYWPLQTWLQNRRIQRRGKEAAAILFQFLDRPSDVGQIVGAEFLPPMTKNLEFDGVSLREPGSGRMLLQDVSLKIKAGQRVAIVGAEDLEKHALVYLIPRFLDPTEGEIRIDDQNLRWVTFDSLRAQTAVVLQHNLVFHDTVANNIGCGDPGFTLPQIIEAAKIAHAHQFIQKLPRGYETVIGEMGHALDNSQQFRIALARAILRDPALLIVEEPSAAMDDDVKDLLDDTLARILPGRTAIFLPHRIATLKMCDRIYLLHKGKLEATGDHRGLLSESRLYRHLHYLEFNEMAEQV